MRFSEGLYETPKRKYNESSFHYFCRTGRIAEVVEFREYDEGLYGETPSAPKAAPQETADQRYQKFLSSLNILLDLKEDGEDVDDALEILLEHAPRLECAPEKIEDLRSRIEKALQ